MKLETALKYLIIGGLFLIPFVPLILSGKLFFPFITPKNFSFRIITEVLLASYLLLMFINESYRPKKSFILYSFVAVIAALAVSTIFGVDPYRSFWSNYERMEGFVTYLHLLALFLVASSVLTTSKLWYWFWHTSIVASVIVCSYATLQLFGKIRIFQSGERLEATFGNATYLAIYLLVHIFLLFYFLVKNGRSLHIGLKIFYAAAILFELTILFYTETRGAVIGFFGGVLATCFLNLFFNRGLARKISAFILAGTLGLFLIFITVKDSEFVSSQRALRRLSGISLTDASVQARFTVWKSAVSGFKERPLFGWGLENFNVVFNKFYVAKLYKQEPWFDRAHNVFLDWLIAGGIVGFISYLLLFASALFYLVFPKPHESTFTHLATKFKTLFSGKHHESEQEAFLGKSILVGLFVAYFIHNIFVFDNIGSHLLFVMLLAFVHRVYAVGDMEVHPVRDRRNSQIMFVIPALAGALVLAIYVANIKPMLASQSLIVAITPHEDKGPEYNLEKFKEAVGYNTFGTPEVREQLLRISISALQIPTLSPEIKKDFFDTAYNEMKKQIDARPLDARYALFLGSYLNKVAQLSRTPQYYDEALIYLEKARELSPAKQSIYFDIIESYIGKKDYKKSFELAETAYKLDESNPSAAVMYAVGAILSERSEFGEEVLTKHFGKPIYPDERLANAYLMVGNKKKSIAILKEIAATKPDLKEAAERYIQELQK